MNTRLPMALLVTMLAGTAGAAQPATAAEQAVTPGGAAAEGDAGAELAEARAQKRALVEANMILSEDQAAAFWPIYDAYQTELEELAERRARLIRGYAFSRSVGTLDDETAQALIADALDLETDEAAMRVAYARELNEVLPATKVMRYLQIESKMSAIVRFELAREIPLVDP